MSANEEGLEQADFALEGKDQTRGWFLSSFLLAAFFSDKPPFKTVAAHGFVVDAKGLKLSKSKGGAPDQRALFDSAGAEALRLWAASQNLGDEVAWSAQALSQAQRELKDWRVFLRFLLANAAPCSSPGDPLSAPRGLDQLALRKLAQAREQWLLALASGRPNAALQKLGAFRKWASSEWFELSKRLLYCARDQDPELLGAQACLRQAFELCLQMLSPFLPFSCEEAFWAQGQSPALPASVHLMELSAAPAWRSGPAETAERELDWRRSLLPALERARALVPKGEPVALRAPNAPPSLSDAALGDAFPGACASRSPPGSLCPQARVAAGEGAFAGRSLAPAWRCARCRAHFEAPAPASPSPLCARCHAEEESRSS